LAAFLVAFFFLAMVQKNIFLKVSATISTKTIAHTINYQAKQIAKQ
jgi:hypothetical protein